MQLHVTILANKYGSLLAYAPFALFRFEYRKKEKRWLFWLRGDLDPDSFPGKTFPQKFFQDACRAMFFVKNGGPLPEGVIISEGQELIKKQVS